MGFGLVAIGCTSSEMVQSPETAQVTADMETQASVQADQTGGVTQPDTFVQGTESMQSTPAVEQPDV